MSKPQITRLTKEELAAEQSSSVAEKAAVVSAPIENRASLYSTEYIKKLPLAEIEKFFEKFDVTACAKIPNDKDPKFVFVSCNGFQVTFSDYSFVFDFNDTLLIPDESKTKFNLQAFADYCTKIEKTPDQVISELMTVELFGQRFPSYGENRKKVKLAENRLAFAQLPKSMQKTLKIANEQKENDIMSTADKLYYGDYAGNPYIQNGSDNQ